MSHQLLKHTGINGTVTSTSNLTTKPSSNHNTSSKSCKPIIASTKSLIITNKTNNNQTVNKKTENDVKNANNSIKVQHEFMDGMTNAIIRYLDKHQDATKTDAEESVFIAIGYDTSIESINSSQSEESKENELKSEINELDQNKHKSFINNICYFRRQHIMRNRDAVRTFRIKQIINNVTKQYPSYSSMEVLIHLTNKLNELYLPSPSPPPPTMNNNDNNNMMKIDDNKCNHNDINNMKLNKHNKCNINDRMNKQILIKTIDNDHIGCSHQVQCRNKHLLISGHKGKVIKNVNYTINHTNNDRNNQITNKFCKNNDNNNNNKKQEIKRDLSPSQIYITLNDITTSSSTTSSEISLKSKKTLINRDNTDNLDNNTMINFQGIGFKESIINQQSVKYLDKKNIILSNLMDCYPKQQNIYTPSQQFYIPSFEDDQVSQKIKLHKKSQKLQKSQKTQKLRGKKRKYANESFDSFDQQQPPKKRTRMDNIHKFGNKGRVRTKNKGRGRGRGQTGKNRNKYHQNKDQEDGASDIDIDIDIELNSNINNLSTTTNSHL